MNIALRNARNNVASFAAKSRVKAAAALASVAAFASPAAFAQVASEIGGTAQTELTGAQTIIVGLLGTLVLIAIGFVVYSLIKKAR
ncbi:hypothetical protein [Xanthomonas campestris]|uniref:hypothetical protein n=1 Tax=Xanthomonas campestris TaxID=339 RepID=UPI002367EAB1|nr:hypothetical protein [Xanthomonas campestris]MEA9838959.1 hypothetical protein [Xanthomonas campestris pv. raphani]WDJ20091.1 hypothetical protein JH264_10650 [Xanthomonas campestris pv. raphani]